MPLENLLFLAGRGIKIPIPEIGSWKQWYCISLKAEVLLFSFPVGWQLYCCLIPETIAALLLTRGLTSLHVLPTRGLPTVLTTQAALLPTKQVGSLLPAQQVGSLLPIQEFFSSVAYQADWQLCCLPRRLAARCLSRSLSALLPTKKIGSLCCLPRRLAALLHSNPISCVQYSQ
jgi:hypothetical protein